MDKVATLVAHPSAIYVAMVASHSIYQTLNNLSFLHFICLTHLLRRSSAYATSEDFSGNTAARHTLIPPLGIQWRYAAYAALQREASGWPCILNKYSGDTVCTPIYHLPPSPTPPGPLFGGPREGLSGPLF